MVFFHVVQQLSYLSKVNTNLLLWNRWIILVALIWVVNLWIQCTDAYSCIWSWSGTLATNTIYKNKSRFNFNVTCYDLWYDIQRYIWSSVVMTTVHWIFSGYDFCYTTFIYEMSHTVIVRKPVYTIILITK